MFTGFCIMLFLEKQHAELQLAVAGSNDDPVGI